MTAIQLRAELSHEMDLCGDDETILAQILDFVKSLTHRKSVQTQNVASLQTSEMTKDDFFAKLDHSRQQAQRGEVYSKRNDETFDQFFTRMQNELQS